MKKPQLFALALLRLSILFTPVPATGYLTQETTTLTSSHSLQALYFGIPVFLAYALISPEQHQAIPGELTARHSNYLEITKKGRNDLDDTPPDVPDSGLNQLNPLYKANKEYLEREKEIKERRDFGKNQAENAWKSMNMHGGFSPTKESGTYDSYLLMTIQAVFYLSQEVIGKFISVPTSSGTNNEAPEPSSADPEGSSTGSQPASSQEKAGNQPPRSQYVTALIIGGGPCGQLAARMLDGLRFTHSADCSTEGHEAGLYCPVRWSRPIPGRRGKTPAGQHFDSFRYGENEEELHCLQSHEEPDSKIDYLVVTSHSTSGSWGSFHPDQKTVSPYEWMSLPDQVISDLNIKKYDNNGLVCTDAASMCRYLEDYSRKIPADRLLTHHRVTHAGHRDNLWQIQVQTPDGEVLYYQSKYLLAALGSTRSRHLNIEGEDNDIVSHNTREAIEAMARLPQNSRILVVGTGLSAADTVAAAWDRHLQVVQLVPAELIKKKINYQSDSSSKTVMKTLYRAEYYPRQARVAQAILGEPHDFYSRMIDYQLKKISGHKCSLVDKDGETVDEVFDHVAILAGSEPDYDFLERHPDDTEKIPDYNRGTMEAILYPGLFIAGASGEKFQKYAYGQVVAAILRLVELEKSSVH